MLEIYWTLCLKSLNFSFYLLLFPFANYYQGLDVGLLQWFSFKILRGKLAHGRPEFTPLRMLGEGGEAESVHPFLCISKVFTVSRNENETYIVTASHVSIMTSYTPK